ncbi:hypothetical protein E0Z10_g9536 [Xylaria hypoxylon]|uniref:Uncharacterized protein n=1 Tax=Xylaria hypoxylon TaxID=37992 RepID=A0A4Z0YRS8_9PEZI|nr:hypothetical protein E0Z10_g9536 [Xylaria hypoxylon]
MQVMVGYYGMCASQPSLVDLKCLPTYSLGESQLMDAFLGNSPTLDGNYVNDLRPLLHAAYTFQTMIFCPLIAASAGLFFLGIIAMLFIKRSMKSTMPQAPDMSFMRSMVSVTMLYAFGLALAAAYSTTQAANALNFTTTGLSGPTPQLEILPGGPIQGLQWTIVGLLVLIQWSVSGMFPRVHPMEIPPVMPGFGVLPAPTLPPAMPLAPMPAPAMPMPMPPAPEPPLSFPMGMHLAPAPPMGMLPVPGTPMGMPQPYGLPMGMLQPHQPPM